MQYYYVGLLIVVLTGCECHFSSDLYVIDNAFADQICSADQIESQTVAGNVISCVRRCAESSGCRSLVYLDDNKACYGIKSDNPLSTSSPLPGTVFYRPGGSLRMTTSTQSTSGSTSGSTVGSTSQSITTAPTTTATATPITTTTTTTPTTTTTTTTTPPTTTTTTTPTTTITTPISTTTSTTTPTTTTRTTTTTTTPTTTTTTTTPTTTTTTTTPTTTTTTTPPTTTTPTTTTKSPTTTTTTPTTTTTTTPTTTTTTTTTPTTTTKAPTTTTTPMATTTSTTTTEFTTTIDPGTPMVIGVEDSQLSASSFHSNDPGYTASDARLNNNYTSWCAASNNNNEYIQVDFLHLVQATHVITKGVNSHEEWTTSYKVLTSTDCISFVAVQDGQGNDKIFTGNVDQDSEVKNAIVPPVVCRCFRINPQTWEVWINIRFEVLGHVV